MKAKDIMTRDVTTVSPDASIHEAARLMTDRRLSGLPVVTAEGRAIGMLTASDLLHRIETGTEREPSWFASFFSGPDELARLYAKGHGRKVSEVMTRHVISVHEDASLNDIADSFERYRIKRVPVLRDGMLVGIISRGDLVRLLSQSALGASVPKSDDMTLQHDLWKRIRKQHWLNTGYLNFEVKDGVVDVWGRVDTAEQHTALMVLVSEVAGSGNVKDHVKVGLPNSVPGWI